MTDEPDNPGIKVPPPLVYLLALLLGLLVDRKVHVPLLPHGMALAGWFVRTMRSADTTIRIDKPASGLVQHGPFHYSRNPGYVALALVYAGIAVLRNALWAILLLPLVVWVIEREVIEREERYLERAFGEEYLTYKKRVRRWV